MHERGNKTLKLIDKYAGSIFLLLLGILCLKRKYKTINRHSNLRIVVLKTGAFGDVLLAGSAIRAIKSKWPESNVTFICTASNVQAVKGLDSVDSIIVFNIKNVIQALWSLRKLGVCDLLIDFAPWARLNGIISWAVKAKYRIGFKTDGMHRHYIYDVQVSHSSKRHELENYKRLIETIGVVGDIPNPRFKIDLASIGPAEELVAEKAIVFHPFPGGAQKHLKSWPLKNWIEFGKKLSAEGYQIIITGGNNDFEEAEAIAKKIGIDRAVSTAGRYDLNQTAYIIKRAGQLISIDTGTLHLGAAVGARVISLHGPTSPERWGAKGSNVIALSARLPCSPCINLGFESKCHFGRCLEAIPVDEVFNAIMKLKKSKPKS